ncbi:MAG: hypothetical protein AAB893_00950 [Patescibacteria group bacterium]
MKVLRKHTSLKKMSKQDDSFVNLSPEERISVICDITDELCSLTGKYNAKRRLQRNVTCLIKRPIVK